MSEPTRKLWKWIKRLVCWHVPFTWTSVSGNAERLEWRCDNCGKSIVIEGSERIEEFARKAEAILKRDQEPSHD